jgi:hypothetical protein
LVLLLVLTHATSAAEEQRLELGVRGGFSFATRDGSFWQAEASASWHLPWHWRFGSYWYMDPRLDLSAGSLQGCGQTGFVGTLGPNFFLGNSRFPLSLNIGFSPTLLSRDSYDCRDFGTPFQMTSHGGLEWAFGARWHLGYRTQHMSNCGTASPNPGLNLHMFSVSFGF